MIDPNLHLTVEQLCEKALDEVRRLCLGPSQRGGRRWTMCVPVQADDSDVLIAGALRRQLESIDSMSVQCQQADRQIVDLRREVEKSDQRAASAERRYTALNELLTSTLLVIRDAGHSCLRHEDVPARVAELLAKLPKAGA